MDLANSIKNHMDEYQGFEEFIDILKKKHLTHTRISRSLLHIMLGLTQDSLKYALDTMHRNMSVCWDLQKKEDPFTENLPLA